MKKRIAIWMHGGIGGGYYGQGIPVISKLVADLISDFDITVYSLYPAASGFKPNGFSFHSVNSRIKPVWFRWFMLIMIFLKHYFKKKCNVLYAFWGFPAGFITVVLSLLVRKPTIIHLQGGDAVFIPSIRYGLLRGFFKKKIILWAYRKCSKLIALTQFQQNCLREFGLTRKIEVIPFGADMCLFHYKENFQPHVPLRFLHVGNLTPVKNQAALLNAFAEITKFIAAELRIVGEDNMDGNIHRYCKELNLEDKVSFFEVQPYEIMPSFYEWTDVLLHTSLYEGQCLAVTEAAACGVLIAGTRVGLLSDWGDTCAVLVEMNESKQLAEGVLKILVNSFEIKKRIKNARKNAANHDRLWTSQQIRDQIYSIVD